jgi:endogenous inhibitor of DNA gyrase (YacG/DUF329 family)
MVDLGAWATERYRVASDDDPLNEMQDEAELPEQLPPNRESGEDLR